MQHTAHYAVTLLCWCSCVCPQNHNSKCEIQN